MKNLIIIGARGFGREVCNIARQCKEYNMDWIIKGFLDDGSTALNDYLGYPPILGPVETYIIQSGDVFVCALGDVNSKYHYVSMIKERGGIFINIIHPSSIIFSNTTIGEGFIACPFSYISSDCQIGNFVTVQPFTVIGHDVIIGNYCHINVSVFIGGFVKIGDFAMVHSGSNILSRVKIGSNVTVGTGSTVIRRISDKCTVFGNPARIVFAE